MRDKNQIGIMNKKHGEIKLDEKELWKHDDCAAIQEIKLEATNENGLRVYCKQYPETFNLQIRTHKPIGQYGDGISRDMIATITLSRKDVKAIYDYMMDEENR